MQYQAIVDLLGYATGQDKVVRIVTHDDQEVVGVPTSLDTDPSANEVFLHPLGDDETEIAISLPRIRAVELG